MEILPMVSTRRLCSLITAIAFIVTTLIPYTTYAASPVSGLPQPGSRVELSPAFTPMLIKGIKVHADNPLLFDFIVDTGNSTLKTDSPALRNEAQQLIKYFLATLAIPEKDLWVNLSPYEKDRIITKDLGDTELGR